MTDLSIFCTKVREVRLKLRLKQGEFSESIGISPTYLSTIETGKQAPTLKVIDAIVKKFDISAEWFFRGTGDMHGEEETKKNLGANDKRNEKLVNYIDHLEQKLEGIEKELAEYKQYIQTVYNAFEAKGIDAREFFESNGGKAGSIAS